MALSTVLPSGDLAGLGSSSLFDVKDKKVLITGGAKGLGRIISEGFVTNGATVFIVSRDAKALENTANELNSAGPGKVVPLCFDIFQWEHCKRLFSAVSDQTSELHVLINNAAKNHTEAMETYSESAFNEVVTLNLQRAFTLTQIFLPLLRKASRKDDPSRVINVGSVDGERVPIWKNFAYSTSKAAMHHLSRILAWHLGRQGITSNTIVTGPFEVGMMEETMKNQKAKAAILEGIPMGRYGKAEDIVGTCIFLTSRAGAHVNGAKIAVDGGVLVRAKI